jgi:2'-hydroxyisoflavone reductase
MKILVLGGTSFVGRTIVEDLLEHGHTPTLFSRGRTGADLFPGVERLVGDRDAGDYEAVEGGTWDAVVDVSAYVPRHVTQVAEALQGASGRYLFISTGSVYDRSQAAGDGMTEDTPRLAPYRDSEQITNDTYGPLKVACEDDVLTMHRDRTTIVRPGIVAGPHDTTDRFTYWARRAPRGGRIAVPGRLDQPVQVVDSRDLARLVTSLLEADRAGTFNAVGPQPAVTLGELIAVCAGSTPFELVSVTPQEGFPLVLPDPSCHVMFRRSAAAALAVGLTTTSLAQTAIDTHAWDLDRGTPPLSVGMTDAQEQELLG